MAKGTPLYAVAGALVFFGLCFLARPTCPGGGASAYFASVAAMRDVVQDKAVLPIETQRHHESEETAFNLIDPLKPRQHHRRYVSIAQETGRTRGETHLGLMWTMLKPSNPRLMYLHQTLTPSECQSMIDLAKKYMQRSGVVSQDGVQRNEVNEVRTSQGTFFTEDETMNHPVNRKLRERLSSAVGLPPLHAEHTQILFYHPGKHYLPHMDAFRANAVKILAHGGQRVVTVLTWLNAVRYGTGGATSFPAAEPKGVSVEPHQGDSVLFYDVNEDGSVDPHSQHGGDPPMPGSEKWVAVMWFHERAFYIDKES